jgi:hypothetical protein
VEETSPVVERNRETICDGDGEPDAHPNHQQTTIEYFNKRNSNNLNISIQNSNNSKRHTSWGKGGGRTGRTAGEVREATRVWNNDA